MRKITVDQVTEGLVLARAVEDRLGRTLLMKGDRLLLRYRDKLREWGISELHVEGDEAPAQPLASGAAPAATAPEVEAIARRLDRRFSGFPADHAVMVGLKALALKHLSAPRKS